MRIATLTSLAILVSALNSDAFAAAASFSGTYRVNGKDAKLNHLIAMPGKGCMFSDDAIGLVFSEKDVLVKPDENIGEVGFNAQMGQFGDAVSVRLCFKHDAWAVESSNYNHAGLNQAAGTWVDQLKIEGMTVANGQYSGHLVSIPDAKILGQPLELNITFHAPKP
jgi:hypothetical protein